MLRNKSILLFWLLILSSQFVHAQAEDSSLALQPFNSFSIGHNLSTTNYTLEKNQWSLGTLYVGYGISDNFTVGTSVFVLETFEMYNFMARYVTLIDSRQKLGFDFAYFKTFGGSEETSTYCSDVCSEYKSYSGFLMEALNLKGTYSYQFTNHYKLNTTLSYFHYFDDRKPFSFRMDPANSDPFALNITTLHEFKINPSFFVNVEAGLWGLNYNFLYYHTGLTLNLQNSAGIFGIGASTTFSPSFPKNRTRQFAGYDSRYSVHPEIQIQLFF